MLWQSLTTRAVTNIALSGTFFKFLSFEKELLMLRIGVAVDSHLETFVMELESLNFSLKI